MPSTKSTSLTMSLLTLALIVVPAVAQQYGSSPGGYSGGGGGSGSSYGSQGEGNAAAALAKSIHRKRQMVAAHSIMACLAWVVLVPLGGILLRLNLKSRWVLRAHGILQVTSYVAYIAAVGLGIYLAQTLEFTGIKFYKDPHAPIGLAILAIGFIEPILGFIHHRIFKRNMMAQNAGQISKKPGRTLPGNTHLWLGRACIFLGMINGGLGLRLTNHIGFQQKDITRKATIGYTVGTLVMFLTYVIIVGRSEIQRMRKTSQADRDLAYVKESKSALATIHSASEHSF